MFTRNGRALIVVSLALFTAGWLLRYGPLVIIGAVLATALVAAVVLVSQRPSLDVQRRVVPDRVTAGQDAVAHLRITNDGRRILRDGVALERFGDGLIPLTIPQLQPGQSVESIERLPTDRRGVFQVGPLVINRSDPFGLVRKGDWKASSATLWVHPLLHDVAAFPSGLARDLDGPSSGEAPEGGVAFQNLREYVVGDDRRLIHWRSSARLNKLMVRHNVDSHQPRSLIVLDTRADVYTGEGFEDAIRAAASLTTSSRKGRFPFKVVTTCGRTYDQSFPHSHLMDEFAGLAASTNASTLPELVTTMARSQTGFSAAVITGTNSVDELSYLGRLSSMFDAVTICRLGPHTDAVELPGTVVINAGNSSEFAKYWNRKVRR